MADSPFVSKLFDFCHGAFDDARIDSYSDSLAESPGVIGTVWLFTYPNELETRVSMLCSPILILLLYVAKVR